MTDAETEKLIKLLINVTESLWKFIFPAATAELIVHFVPA